MATDQYENEAALVHAFLAALQNQANPWGDVTAAVEFYYGYGKTDVVALSQQGELLAFEAKLEKWKVALDQAYRNTSFATLSLVVLPPRVAKRAARYANEFDRRRVGICTVDGNGIQVLLDPERGYPINPSLHTEAESFVRQKAGDDGASHGAGGARHMCAF